MPKLARAAILAGGAALAAAPSLGRAQTLEKIRLGGVPTDDLTAVFYAIKNGAYQQAGLDVEFIPTMSGTAATTAVVSGAYELGKASLIASLVAHLRNLPIVVVGNNSIWDHRVKFSLILTADDSPIKSAADCNGKIAATAALNDIAQLGIMTWVDKNGGDSKTLKWLEIPSSACAAALAEHRTDIASLNEPLVSAALDGGKCRVLGDGLSAIGDGWVYGVFISQPDWAAKHRDAIVRFMRVTYETAKYTNVHQAETIPMMSEITKIPAPTYQRIARAIGATSGDPRLIQPAIAAAAKYKFIAHAFPAKELYFNG